jgi:hypothetical protein
MTQPAWMETIFDRTPQLRGIGPVEPIVYDASAVATRRSSSCAVTA